MEKIELSQKDIDSFFGWLDLNLTNITWEGRNRKMFNEFWKLVFIPGTELQSTFSNFNLILQNITAGTFTSWIKWLRSQFIIYIFKYKDLSIKEISDVCSIKINHIALILRDYFADIYPANEEIINDLMQIADDFSEKSKITYTVFSENLDEEFAVDVYAREDEILMANLEVTLFKDFPKIIKTLNKRSENKKILSIDAETGISLKRQLIFFKEVFALLIIAATLMFVVVQGNKYYEKNLASKISLFQPNFFWLDTSLSYKEKSQGKVEVQIKELDLVEDKSIDLEIDSDEQRFDVESEMVITSVDDIPQNLGTAEFEDSEYEEKRKGGYRDSRYGSTKTYKIMMRSEAPDETKIEINKLADKFEAKPLGEVKPGTIIPGGLYYNLLVPSKNLKDFLAQIDNIKNVTIYESKSSRGAPYGQRKVFIWVKSI